MTRKEIAVYRQNLRDILKKKDERQRLEDLKQLAKEVGAGYVHTEIAGTSTIQRGTATETTIYQNPISEAEIVLNINNSLQTETMIDACKSANRSWIVALIAVVISIISIIVALRDC